MYVIQHTGQIAVKIYLEKTNSFSVTKFKTLERKYDILNCIFPNPKLLTIQFCNVLYDKFFIYFNVF